MITVEEKTEMPGYRARAWMREVFVAALTLAAGAVDVVSFLRLGRVFTSNMTGNVVLLGVTAGQGLEQESLGSATALAGFAAGLVIGFRIVGRGDRGRDEPWPVRVTAALGVEAALLAVFAAGWAAADAHPSGSGRFELIAVSAVAMGIQTASAQRLAHAGISTTYVTGTLTALTGELATLSGRPGGWLRRGTAVVALGVGATLGMVLLHRAPLTAPLVPLAVLIAVSGGAGLWLRRPSRAARDGVDR